MGAIIGAIYAQGYTSEYILNIVEEYKPNSLFRLLKLNFVNGSGISSHKNVEEILSNLIPHNSFEELKHKFYLSVTDILIPDWKIISSGDLKKYILASMSIPVVFEPMHVDGRYLVDGGVMNNLPVEPLIENDCFIIGIDVQDVCESHENIGVGLIARRLHNAMIKECQKPRVAKCDLYINFPELSKYHIDDFAHYEKIIDIGYQRTLEILNF